jgi:hypothetical protein
MSSIFELFGDPSLADEAGDAPFDATNLDKVLDEVIASRPVAGRPVGYDPSTDGGASAPTSDGEGTAGAEGGTAGGAAPVPPEAPPPVPPPATPPPAAQTPPPAAEPFADLTDMERLELSQLRQALGDPERALAVRRAMLGVEAPPLPSPESAAASAPVPEPTLPEEIDPTSFEAQLWHQNQAMQRELAEIKAGQQQNQQLTEQQIVQQAARTATNSFATRYAGRLSKEEIEAVCQHAGLQKLPEAFRPVSQSWEEAMDKALEFTVRSNDGLLAKVLGVTPAAGSTPAPGQRSAEADTRGRKLTALSSAASPSGEATTRVPLEHRGDGKLTEKSRFALVQELVNGDGSLRSTE